ncbi:hypothetical protein RND81_05G255200 [Saponaria officinalis]|uniref:Late embryogenesis abundant protein LEA-2 subgroup domain-containing protein n=1 Tax=Saponaria officinalis TaxID=3572 RepID=A0AAW1L1Q1_SAPOF
MTDPTRPATGYPAPPTNGYPQPPHQQQQPPPSSYYYPNYNQQQYYLEPPPPRAVFFRRFMSALVATFIIIGVILFIIWLILRPRVPIFTVDSISLSSLNLSSTAPPSEISATWTVHFTVSNPNSKLHVYYDQIIARIYYKSSFITQNQLPPFDQPTKNQTAVTAILVASSAYIPPDIVKDFNGDRSKGSVKFDVQMIALVRFKSGGWRARTRYLRVLCDDLPLSVTSNASNGTLSGGSRRCASLI